MSASRAALLAPAAPPNDDAPSGAWFDLAATLLVSLAPGGVVARANASARRYADGADVVGAPVWETALVAHSPASASALRDAVASAAAGRRVTLDVERRDGDGAVRTAEFTLTPVDGGGAVLAEGHDVTAARAEARRQRDLLGAASHELRTPLVGVRGALGMLDEWQAGRHDRRTRDLVRLARANADRLMRCVTDLLDIEHIRGGAVPVSPQPTSAGDVARAAVEAVDPLSVERRVRLVVRDTPAGSVLADHDRTAQAVATLVSNVVYAAARGGTLRVLAARTPAGRVRITVEDASGAVPPERRAALVRQIERVGVGDGPAAADSPLTLADALTATRGSDAEAGLGLAIARALVERQGGTLGACADADRSAVCWVELPAAPDAPGATLALLD
jgi:signal transduction histidine kinase